MKILRSNRVCWMKDGPPRFHYLMCEEEKRSRCDLDLKLHMCFFGFNMSRANSLDERMRSNHF